jgi:hypothetical protein
MKILQTFKTLQQGTNQFLFKKLLLYIHHVSYAVLDLKFSPCQINVESDKTVRTQEVSQISCHS